MAKHSVFFLFKQSFSLSIHYFEGFIFWKKRQKVLAFSVFLATFVAKSKK